jgi:hypothetical protein
VIFPPVVGEVNVTAFVADPVQTIWSGIGLTVGVGFTVMVNVLDGPVHVTFPAVVNLGVTVTVAVTGELVVLTAVNEPMLPVPLAARPIEGRLLVQL